MKDKKSSAMNIWLIRWFHNCFGGRGTSGDYAAIFGILVKRKTAVTHSVARHDARQFPFREEVQIMRPVELDRDLKWENVMHSSWVVARFTFLSALNDLLFSFSCDSSSRKSLQLRAVAWVELRACFYHSTTNYYWSGKFFKLFSDSLKATTHIYLVSASSSPAQKHRISFSPRAKIHSTLSFLFILSSEHP